MSKLLEVIVQLLLFCGIATAKFKFEEETCHSFGPDAHVYPQTTSTLDHKLQYTKAVSEYLLDRHFTYLQIKINK